MRLKALFVLLAVAVLLLCTLRTKHAGRERSVAVAQVERAVVKPSSPAKAEAGFAASKLPQALDVLWKNAPPEPTFAAFAQWTDRYVAARDAALRTRLEAEGIDLARKRLSEMADLIVTDPQRALERAVPRSVRSELPASVRELLEQPVNAKGDFEVVGILPLPGRESETPPIVRTARINDLTYQAFPFGDGLGWVTRNGVPFNGISVPVSAATTPPANPLYKTTYLLALGSPPRVLEASERNKLKSTATNDPICLDSGNPTAVNNDETFIELAGKIYTFCGKVHASDWAASAIAGAGLSFPGGTTLPIAESSYTEGRKRLLLMRPIFTDYTSIMTTNQALSHYIAFSNFMYELSYGKHVLAGLRSGSDITPELLLPGVVADYDNTGLGKLYNTCKDVATTNFGYDLSKYDFLYVCTAGRPSATYAGLAFVGGVGFHLANSYWGEGTASHEYGHNLGLNHANFWQTDGKSVIGLGTSIEYGDNDDPMGGAGTSPNSYGSRYKNYLNWIHDSDIATVTNNGTYRLYTFDNNVGVGLRGLRFPRDASVNYWLQYRTRKGGKARSNGAQVLWTGNDNRNSRFLDMMLKNGSGDNALTIGRTFSDTNFDLHITPIGKGNTFPESLDIVVNRGPFPGNLPPTLAVTASSSNPATAENVTFTAAAIDPNGDTLAYTWDFGDNDYSIDNKPVTTHAFASTGEYAVQCTVSDMKGATARATVIVRVGNPSTFRISGHVLGPNNEPYAGIRVFVDSTHFAYSDSDGSYTITRLAAGSYTLDAFEPVAAAATLIHPFFNNPVVVGPDFTSADFVAIPGTLTVANTLSPRNANWRYLDKGTDQGTTWITPAFNDSGWSNGPAILGYGQGGEATVISYGPDANNKYITSYFRRQFNVPDPTIFTNLLLETMRDDGVIVYLNGTEVYRDNMPLGAVNYQTFASATVEPAGYQAAQIARSALVAGNNVLSAEVHQSDITSSDLTFDCALSGLSMSNVTGLSFAYITSPANNQSYTTPTGIVVRAAAGSQAGASPVQSVSFYADGNLFDTVSNAPYVTSWSSPPLGTHSLNVVAKLQNNRLVTSRPISVSVAAPSTLTLVQTGAVWKYFSSTQGPAADWATSTYDDSTWPVGPAQLGYGEGDEQTVIPDNPSSHYTAAYFRTEVIISDPGAITNATVQLLRDDGAAVYFNGVEVLRDNLPPGPLSYGTLATNANDDGKTFFNFKVDPSALTPGVNIIAVEVHNSSPGSGDLSFDFGLVASVNTNRARGVWLTSPAAGSSVRLPGTADLVAQVVAGGSLGVQQVDFLANGTNIGSIVTAPFQFAWTNPPAGTQQLVAVALDTAGGSITSAPVQLIVALPPTERALISFGDVWKYLDDGSDQGTAWRARFFDDRTWASGAARLGYGGDGETTTVSYGTNSNSKYITTWFRKAFIAPNPRVFNGLLLRLIRDDGAVVYLNGVEVFRSNLQAGLVSWNSLATSTVDSTAETTPVEVILNAALVTGTNVVAVEVHQAALTSSDLGFDLELTGLNNTNVAQGVYLTTPAEGAHYNSPGTVLLSASAVATGSITAVQFFDGAAQIGQSGSAPYSLTWSNAIVGTHSLTARALLGSGQSLTSPPVSIVVGPPPAPILPVFNTLIAVDSDWKYWDSATTPGHGWQTLAYNDAAWPSGRARFGWGLDGEMTLLTEGRVTHYFRRWFTPTNAAALTELFFELIRDDGAVVYLNGTEVFRSNIPDGPIDGSTLATTTVNTPEETTWFETLVLSPSSGLIGGSNLVAVELHQASATSSDAAFNLGLFGTGNTDRRVYLGQPITRAPYFNTAPVPIEAFGSAGSGLNITSIEFFADGTKIGEATTAPYRMSWSGAAFGPHQLVARMHDNTGATLDSAPVTIQLTRELITTTLIASNSVWKYLDNGSNQGTNWSQPSFNDSTWSSGAARLGYGGDGEVTTVSYGGNANAKFITTYFRRLLVVPNGLVYTNLLAKLVRDDGAVIYINGKELLRNNMPATIPVPSTALASTNAGGTDEQTFFAFNVPTTNLISGTNIIAVEVHQSGATSSDLGFNLELVGSGYIVDSTPPHLDIAYSDNLIELSWSETFLEWALYSSDDVSAPFTGWAPVSGNPILLNGRRVLTISPTGSNRFYRLARP